MMWGDMHHVTTSGEPAIGKSRIAQTVLERLSGEPHTRSRYSALRATRTGGAGRRIGKLSTVLMVVDYVHWGDPTVRKFLDLLIDRVPSLGCWSSSRSASLRPAGSAVCR
jgi:hypothetical protein